MSALRASWLSQATLLHDPPHQPTDFCLCSFPTCRIATLHLLSIKLAENQRLRPQDPLCSDATGLYKTLNMKLWGHQQDKLLLKGILKHG
jgi:hypothetical protein